MENFSERIMTNRLDRGFFRYQKEFEDKALEVLRSGWYVLGKEVSSFEEEFASYIGAKYCVGLASGLDALILAFRALKIGEGDEVIVQANTYIASVMGISVNGATPVFVEPDDNYQINVNAIEDKITDKTKAILIVHLYGQATDMGPVLSLCKKYDLKLVEDCAQSHGAKYKGQTTGTFGDIGCFSFYPSKNLGAFGDGGAIVTDDPSIDKEIRMLRNYGSEKRYYNKVVGVNSRLDEIQAGLLRVRLSHMDELAKEKTEIAEKYREGMKNPLIRLPQIVPDTTHIYHQFVIRVKDRAPFIEYLKDRGIDTIIHYPIPPHLSEAYAYLGFKKGDLPMTELLADEVLSLPMYNGMTDDEIMRVIDAVNEYGA
ncbi:MAG TPA: aminotransferase [Lachnospiraceae bacterium]|nr:aminotransferase [Lachnospiraceae bacterium]